MHHMERLPLYGSGAFQNSMRVHYIFWALTLYKDVLSYQSHDVDKTVVRSPYLHNSNSSNAASFFIESGP